MSAGKASLAPVLVKPYHFPRPLGQGIRWHARTFHSSPRRDDIFFVALPALKGALLNVTRFSLLLLPFAWKYR